MRRFALVAGVLLMVWSATLLWPAKAAETFTVTFDSEDDAPYTIGDGSITSGGYEGDALTGEDIGGDVYQLTVNLTIDPECDISHLFFRYKATNSRPIQDIGITATYFDAEDTVLRDEGTSSGAGLADNTWREFEDSPSGLTGVVRIRLLINWGGFSTYGGSALMDNIEYTCDNLSPTLNWTRPLRSSDEVEVYDFTEKFANIFSTGPMPDIDSLVAPPVQNRVTAVSTEGGQPVMTAQSGKVTDITYGSAVMCAIWGVLLENTCYFAGPDEGESLFNLYKFSITADVQLVTIDIDGDAGNQELHYLVNKANHYLTLNQEINEGCVIGETIPAEEATATQVALLADHAIADHFSGVLREIMQAPLPRSFGVSQVELWDTGEDQPVVPLAQNLTVYNEEAEPCNINPNFRDCLLDDPDLKHGAAGWTLFGDAEATDGGVSLRPDSYIEQVRNLPDSATFTFRIGVYYDLLDLLGGGPATDRTITVRVGSFSDTITIPPSDQYHEYTLEVPTPDPDSGGLGYTVRIANTGGGGGVIVQAACLSTDDHELNPRMCYFFNPDFDSLDGWLATTTQTGAGFVNLGDLDYVSQDVTLEPNEDDTPRTYHLVLDVRIIAAPGETLDTSTGTATMFYAWEGTNTVGTLDLTWNNPGEPGYPDAYQTLSTDIVVTEHSSDTFYISSGIDGNDTIHIALSRACLTTDDIPPGSGVGGPFQTTCSTISVPTDGEIGSWTLYHWRNLDKFFNCKLMVLLNKWFKLFDEFRRTTLLVFRWGIAFVNKAVDWSVTLMWWLNGHFRNIAMGQVTTITDGGGCHDIFCAITDVVTTLANLLTPIVAALNNVVNVLVGVFVGVVNLFFTMINGLVSFVVALLIRLFGFLNTAISLLTGLIGAYNSATPTAIPGLPTCAIDPTSSPLCWFFWVSDNTLFQGRWNALYILILSILSIHFIIWAIKDIRDTILKTWGSS